MNYPASINDQLEQLEGVSNNAPSVRILDMNTVVSAEVYESTMKFEICDGLAYVLNLRAVQ